MSIEHGMTEQQIKDQITKLQDALKVVQESNNIPNNISGVCMMTNFPDREERLVIKVTQVIKDAVNNGATYLTITPLGGLGNCVANRDYINREYTNPRPVFTIE